MRDIKPNEKSLFIAAKNETELQLLERFKKLTWFCAALIPYFVGSHFVSALRGSLMPQFLGSSVGEVLVKYFGLLAGAFVFGYVYEFLMLLWLKRIAFGADNTVDRRTAFKVVFRALLVWLLSFFVSLPGTVSDLAQVFLSLPSQLLLALFGLATLFVLYRFATLKAFVVLGCGTREAFRLSFKSSAVKGYFKFLLNLLLKPFATFLALSVVAAMILALFANAVNVSESQLVFFVSAFASVVAFAVLRYYPRIQLSLLNYAKQFREYNGSL